MIRWEIKKLLKPTWLFIVLGLVATIWIAMMYFANASGEQRLIKSFFSYWSELGSLTLGGIILFVSTKLFSIDADERIKEVVLATKYGKGRLLLVRFCTIMLFTVIVFSLLTIIQLIGLMLFTDNGYRVFEKAYYLQILSVFIGSQLFAIFAACICIILSSHASTVTLCAFLFGFTYIFRSNYKGDESFFSSFDDLLDKGFFSYLMRADFISNISLSVFSSWYGLLMAITIALMLTIQSRRHEL